MRFSRLFGFAFLALIVSVTGCSGEWFPSECSSRARDFSKLADSLEAAARRADSLVERANNDSMSIAVADSVAAVIQEAENLLAEAQAAQERVIAACRE